MVQLDLSYPKLLETFGEHAIKERTESRQFLAWFLEHYYRLEETEISDCICDGPYDKGIDGLYVDDHLGKVDVFQAKISRSKKTLGDVSLKEFVGTLSQFSNANSTVEIATTTNNKELAALIRDAHVAERIAEGYQVNGIFITNAARDANATAFLKSHETITLFDSEELERSYLPLSKTDPIHKPITFDISGVPHMEYPIEVGVNMVVAPIAASELLRMDGIASGELFAWNVRQWLGKKTKVNKDIARSIATTTEHKYFPAFHNGLTVLCRSLKLTTDKITIDGYAVVNGCQSLTGLYENQGKISDDLRLLTKVVSVAPDTMLANKITDHTNNQNGTTHRDLKSNSLVQTRLQSEIHDKYSGEVYYRIKRGEHPEWPSAQVIENELAARCLLAFDLRDPSSCHQTYKLFDEKYADIFGRKEVTADRIVAVNEIYKTIVRNLGIVTNENRLFASYTLTRFLVLYLVREALETDPVGQEFFQNPSAFMKEENGRARLKECMESLVKSVIRPLDNEVARLSNLSEVYDYKRQLKSPKSVGEMRTTVIAHYQVILDNGYAPRFSDQWTEERHRRFE